MGIVAVLVLLISLALAFAAMVLLIIDCQEDSQSVCSTGGYGQFAVALLGVALSFGALIAGAVGRGRPGVWLCAAVFAFATWFVVAFAVGGSA